jgi:hypothetical protein
MCLKNLGNGEFIHLCSHNDIFILDWRFGQCVNCGVIMEKPHGGSPCKPDGKILDLGARLMHTSEGIKRMSDSTLRMYSAQFQTYKLARVRSAHYRSNSKKYTPGGAWTSDHVGGPKNGK